uniref:Lipid droplet-associated hydrolase n=1 Tax=Peromyscus maniculatus bairdii TaxID=230844 RepID=A0A8C8UKA6_PERMB
MASEVQEEIPVHEEFFLCGGVETQILKCGPWTNLFDTQSVTRPKLLIFIIPGNPGFSPFYLPFAKNLYSLTKGSFPVWMISHAGFTLVPKDKKILTAPDVVGWWECTTMPNSSLDFKCPQNVLLRDWSPVQQFSEVRVGPVEVIMSGGL